jgi:hypothetical protein
MKKIISLLCSSIIFFTPFATHEIAYSQQHITEPPYAKWGRYGLDAVKKKYNVTVVDYLHVSRQNLTPSTTQEKFKFWVRDKNNHEFGVYVTITFETNTEKILSVQFRETSR